MNGVAGSPAHVAAYGIFSDGVLPFDHAYALARLVLQMGGGPATFSGRKPMLPRACVKPLESGGFAEQQGTAQFDPDPAWVRYTWPARLGGPDPGDEVVAELVGQAVRQRVAWVLVARQEGVDLVADHLPLGT